MFRRDESPLGHELEALRAQEIWVRGRLYSVAPGKRRATATTAVAAAAAEQTYRLSDGLPQWQNDTSGAWRDHLARVWAFLAGDASQHYELSAALAEFLVSPLNHIEGQDGPDDFDRPQTVASYSAVASALMWGVDFATTAVGQIFECLDLKYDGEFTAERKAEVNTEMRLVRNTVDHVAAAVEGAGLTPETIAALRT